MVQASAEEWTGPHDVNRRVALAYVRWQGGLDPPAFTSMSGRNGVHRRQKWSGARGCPDRPFVLRVAFSGE
jgi:hypothetical protein